MKKTTNFQNRVLLTLDSPSEIAKKYDFPYAILLIQNDVINTYTIPVEMEYGYKQMKEKDKSPFDRVPKTQYTYAQSCIVYWNKSDLTKNKGVYQEYLPEFAEDNLFEYTAQII